jgi:hypothetical protein
MINENSLIIKTDVCSQGTTPINTLMNFADGKEAMVQLGITILKNLPRILKKRWAMETWDM